MSKKRIKKSKQTAHQRIAAVLIFILTFICVSPVFAKEPLSIAYPDYWPFFSRTENGTMAGIFYDIITTALRDRMDVPVQWDEFPWKRCQWNVRKGRSDAMITVPTAERLEYSSTHRHPFYNKTMNIFTYAGHPEIKQIRKIKTLEDLAGSGLKVITYAGNGWNDEHIRSLDIPVVESHMRKGIWNMLDHKRGDVIIEWPGGAWPDIYKLGLQDKIIQTDIILESMPFHLLISKESPYIDRLDQFDKIISQMLQNGTIGKIVDRYRK